MVYVISNDNKPLMPCSNVIARLLLKQGRAKVKLGEPFTIKLLYDTTTYTQDCILGVDTGSKTIGAAVISNDKVVYVSEVQIRDDIKKRMDRRRTYRSNRRNRKTRYRQARWSNRKNSTKLDRFSPTMVSKLNSHIKEIEFVKKILPVTQLVLETATFDTHLMKNPKLYNENYKCWGYQHGPNYGFENTKSKVLNRDNYTCQVCKGKHKDPKLEVHHIVHKSNGGSDEETNLITLCHTCHKDLHSGKVKPNFKGKVKGQLRYATQMNSIRVQLLKHYSNAVETFGYITKANRQQLNLPKEHFYDAVVIASEGKPVEFLADIIYYKRCVPKGDYQRSKGVRSQLRIPKGKILKFLKFDKVKYLGKEYFIKGRMSGGGAVLADIFGHAVDFSYMPKGRKTAKLKFCKRVTARNSWLIQSSKFIL